MVSAQAQIPPPDYRLICNSLLLIDVDPETSTPPTGTIECSIYNEESYSIELSLQTDAGGLDSSLSVDEISVGANSEEFFQVTVEAENGMKIGSFQITTTSEVTKTGELDYSDDDPKISHSLADIMQFAAFKVEPHQFETDYNLVEGESFEMGYTITNLGNFMDKFSIGLYSYTSRICDVGRASDDGRTFGECDGGNYAVPISDDCDEKLDIKLNDRSGIKLNDRSGFNVMFDYEQTIDFFFTVSTSISNSSCWPIDSNGDLTLSFNMFFSLTSDFHNTFEDVYGEHWESDASRYDLDYLVDVTISNDEGILDSVVPGFESSYLLLCLFFTAIFHNRKSSLY